MSGHGTRRAVAYAATALVLALCLWPKGWMPAKEEVPKGLPHSDKAVHFGMFAVFGASWVFAVSRTQRSRALLLVAGLALAAGTEWAQGFPAIGRDPDVLDALADLGGVTVAVAAAAVFWPVTRPARTGELAATPGSAGEA